MIEFDAIPTIVSTPIIVLTGTTHPAITELQFGTDPSALLSVQVEHGRFSIVIELEPGDNDYTFVGLSISGGFVHSTRKNIRYAERIVRTLQIPNTLDHHGEMLGYNRFRGEMNPNYRTRLLQGAMASDMEYIHKAAATEIAVPFSLDLLRVWVLRSQFNRPLLTRPHIRITLETLEITANELRVEEIHTIDRGYPYILTDQILTEIGPVELFTEAGEQIPKTSYELDDINRVLVKDLDLAGNNIVITYQTVVSFPLNTDIATLVSAVQVDGRIGIEFTENQHHTDTDPADWLIPRVWEELDATEQFPAGVNIEQPGNRFSISEVKTFALHQMRRHLLNEEGNGMGTLLQLYVDEINRIDRRTWERVVVGRDGLRDAEIVPLFDAFPHITDNDRSGARHLDWQSGIGSTDDLEPSVVHYSQLNADDTFDRTKLPPNPIYGVL